MAHYLVTGGAGFIGSHMVLALTDRGHTVTVLDSLGTGHRQAVPAGTNFLHANLLDRAATRAALHGTSFDAVFHFAGLCLVAESLQAPLRYVRENLLAGLNLIEAAIESGIPRFVLSSTAALFGTPATIPIGATAPANPASPYGASKRMLEETLHWAAHCHGLRFAALRYFNAAGADPAGRAGEDHRPETHLIPAAIDAALGRRPPLVLNGTDYPTPDGTCIRDYIHVSDLAEAHLRVLPLLDHTNVTLNVGTGTGHSVRTVIDTVSRLCGRPVPTKPGPRRDGDPPVLVADPSDLIRQTGWQPTRPTLEEMVQTALDWRRANPHGYG